MAEREIHQSQPKQVTYHCSETKSKKNATKMDIYISLLGMEYGTTSEAVIISAQI